MISDGVYFLEFETNQGGKLFKITYTLNLVGME